MVKAMEDSPPDAAPAVAAPAAVTASQVCWTFAVVRQAHPMQDRRSVKVSKSGQFRDARVPRHKIKILQAEDEELLAMAEVMDDSPPDAAPEAAAPALTSQPAGGTHVRVPKPMHGCLNESAACQARNRPLSFPLLSALPTESPECFHCCHHVCSNQNCSSSS